VEPCDSMRSRRQMASDSKAADDIDARRTEVD
jgi:hypothetical protein